MIKIFREMGLTDSLAHDFAWVVSCAQENAAYGYGIRTLFVSNATVHDLMEISGHRMEKMITIAGRIGRLQCAGDEDEKDKALQEFRTEARRQGYIIEQ